MSKKPHLCTWKKKKKGLKMEQLSTNICQHDLLQENNHTENCMFSGLPGPTYIFINMNIHHALIIYRNKNEEIFPYAVFIATTF